MIGVFDSGLGGLTVVKEIFRQLPGVGVVYFGDTARTPYGNKSADLVVRYALEDAAFLRSQGAELIVVACNTASAVASDVLRADAAVPVFEVVMPAVEKAAAVTSGRIGLIGTRATVASGVYERELAVLAPHAEVYSQACPLFVPLVEEGWTRRPETGTIAGRYLAPLTARRIDTLILGCTHYPFLRPAIADAAGRGVHLIDPAKETVAALGRFLADDPAVDARVRRDAARRFFVSDRTEAFAAMASDWLGMDVELETVSLEAESAGKAMHHSPIEKE